MYPSQRGVRSLDRVRQNGSQRRDILDGRQAARRVSLRIKPSLTAILNEKAWTNVQAFLLHVPQSERGEKPRQGSTKWLAAQRHFGRPTGRPQGELANQALSHRHIPRESLNSRSDFFLHVPQSERGEKPRRGSTKWLAAQRHFGRPTGRPQGELANQALSHRHIK